MPSDNLTQRRFPLRKAVGTILLAVLGLGAIRLGQLFRFVPWYYLGASVPVIVSVILALVIIGRHILGPLDAAARHRRRPTQFTMADFLALMFLLQLPVAVIQLVVRSNPSGLGLVYVFAWVASSLMWGLSVQTLSRAGVTTPWRRVVFLSAVLPIAYFGSVVFVGTILLASIDVLFFDESERQNSSWYVFATDAILLGTFYWAASFVRATVACSQNDELVQEIRDTPETAGPVNPLD